ncbi:MAG: hypothetical protein ACJAU1_000440 [Psychromonas sp.]|jgi:hypothetical protein
MVEKIVPSIKRTKIHMPGFKERFYAICSALGKKKFGRVRFLTTISGLSWSGAKTCIEDDRPPKRTAALDSIATQLSQLFMLKSNIDVSAVEVQRYLTSGTGPLVQHLRDFVDPDSLTKWDISSISPTLNARVVLMIHKVAKDMKIDVFSDLEKKQFELLNRKMTVYCHQYHDPQTMESDNEVIELCRSMIIVARAKLL